MNCWLYGCFWSGSHCSAERRSCKNLQDLRSKQAFSKYQIPHIFRREPLSIQSKPRTWVITKHAESGQSLIWETGMFCLGPQSHRGHLVGEQVTMNSMICNCAHSKNRAYKYMFFHNCQTPTIWSLGFLTPNPATLAPWNSAWTGGHTSSASWGKPEMCSSMTCRSCHLHEQSQASAVCLKG